MTILDIKFKSTDLNEELTIREYLKTLLSTLWDEGEGFSGKRPFGNSGWQWDIYKVLIENDVVKGKLDSDGYIDKLDESAAIDAIQKAIGEL